jgi:hypothetical protein
VKARLAHLGGLLALLLLVLSGCATAPRQASALEAASPRSILIVPVVNQSLNVAAPDYFLSTVSRPLVDKGYYVFPVNAVKRLLEDDGLSDANLVHNAPASRLARLFGADAVLYVSIDRWDARYLVVATQVTVQLSYTIKDGQTDEVLWQDRQTILYQPETANSGNPLVDLAVNAVNAAITKAAPNYLPLARQANQQAFNHREIPPGPYALEAAEP